MVTISAQKIRELLKVQFPELRHIWIFDKRFVLLSRARVDDILEGVDAFKNTYKDELFDCDDFALVANAFVKLKSVELGLPNSWAFGEVSLVHPEKGVHNQNIYITEDFKIKLFEPQNNQSTDHNNETVFYVRI